MQRGDDLPPGDPGDCPDPTAGDPERVALRRREERLRLATDASDLGLYDADAVTGEVYWSPAMRRLLGVTADAQPPPLGEVPHFVHPDDAAQVRRLFEEALAPSGAGRFFNEHRIVRPDGSVRWVRAQGQVICGGTGEERRAVRVVGALMDITDRKHAEEEARQRLAEIEDLYRNAPVGLCVLDRELRWVRINDRLAEFNGFSATNHVGRRLRDLLPSLAEAVEPGILDVFATGRPRHGVEIVGETPAQPGVTRSWVEHLLPLLDERGEVTGVSIVVEETTERRRAEDMLREADRRKDEFLATLAHELRNPLVPIRNAVEILRLQATPDPALQRVADLLDRQVQHLVRLVDDLLDVARISRGKLALRRERVALADVLDRAVEAVRPSIEGSGQQLAVSLPPQPVALDADPVRLSQVFCNLLDNASKFTGRGGSIRVDVQCEGAEVTIAVSDSGIGIAAGQLPSVFDMFAQLPMAAGSVRSGLGIGLALTRGLVAMHGGRIEARSDGLGKGSTFVVRLPQAPEAGSVSRLQRSTAVGASAACHVLVADDHADVLDSLVMLLQLHGHEVTTARDGVEAVDAASRRLPDLVLLDLGMPRLDGHEACRRIRGLPGGHRPTIVALSGWGQPGDRRRTEEAGFDGHLVKPAAPAAILELVAKALARGR